MICAHCVMKTRNSIDEDVHLILEQNDVTNEFWKIKERWLHGFRYFHTQSNNNMYHGIVYAFLEDGTIAMAALFYVFVFVLSRNAWSMSFSYMLMYTYFFVRSMFVYMIYICIFYFIHIYVYTYVHQHIKCVI